MKHCINRVYRASNLGVSHQAELLGFNEPVYIDNLAPSLAETVVAVPQPAPAVVVRSPSEVFAGQAHATPEVPVTYVFSKISLKIIS